MKPKQTESLLERGARNLGRGADSAADLRKVTRVTQNKSVLQSSTHFQPSTHDAGLTRRLAQAGSSSDATHDHYHRVLAEFSSPATQRVRVNAKKPLV